MSTRPAVAPARELATAACLSLAAGGLVLLSVGGTWIRFMVRASNGLDVKSRATGHEVAGSGTSLALVVLAGVVILPATRGRGRLAAGALVALSGLGIVVSALQSVADPSAAVASRAAQVAGVHSAKVSGVTGTVWPWLALLGGVLAFGVGCLVVVRSNRWPAMGRRYAAGAGARPSRPAEDSMWDRLDVGDDPTV